MSRVLAAVVLIAACDPGGEPGVNRQEIVNGTADTSHSAVIALISVNSLSLPSLAAACTGTIVAVDAGAAQVLTAAHCFDHLDAGWVTLAVVGDDDSDFLDAGVPVREIALHPFYTHGSNGVFADDFAMARFDAKAAVATIPPLPPALDDLQPGSAVTLVGYGFTDPSADVNTHRRGITQPIWQLDSALMVFDDHDGGQCQGDSGGPALYVRDGREYVAGVISSGDLQCAEVGTAGRVSPVFDAFVSRYLQGLPPLAVMSCDDCQGQSVAAGGACAAAYDACSNDAHCVALASCENGCSGGACIHGCEQQQPQGVAKYAALNNCSCRACADSCAAQCAAPDAGMPGDGGPDAGTPPDAGLPAIDMPGPLAHGGCGCASGVDALPFLALLLRRSRRRRFLTL
jgi:hypothetical protein